MPTVITVGELLVEVMRPEDDLPFGEAGTFVGPFPSGAPAIFADAVARLEASSGVIGAVGDDGFGRCLVDRLNRDGVDTSLVRTSDRRATGVAFVAYFSDGERRFIFHMEHAAAGTITADDVPESTFVDADALHINGSSLLVGDHLRKACYEAIDIAVDADLLVSLDPNLRPDLMDPAESRAVLAPALEQADVVTPTAAEATALVEGESVDSETAADCLLEQGASHVAIKRGADGCTLHTAEGTRSHRGFAAKEVDPTGAGDAFSAATVVGILEGMTVPDLAAFANAAGALAVTEQGPMEGLAPRDEVEALIASRE